MQKSFPDAEKGDILPMLGIIILMSVLMFVTFRILIRNQLVAEVEVNGDGLRHIAPGKERLIKWNDIMEIKKTPKGRSIIALRLITSGKNYDIFPYLVSETPGSPIILFKLNGPTWLREDNSTEPFALENSAAYEICKQYVPDLLKKAEL